MNLLLESILSVLYPPLCPCCGTVMVRGEGPMCLSCRLKLPETDFHLSPSSNDLMDKLQGLVPVEGAVAYFRYRRNSPQARLIHDMKYRGCPDTGRRLAREYAQRLRDTGFFDGVDAIAPVPLNFWRHCRRGYNQSAHIALGLADVSGLPVINALSARPHNSQTRLDAAARSTAARGIYRARPDALSGLKHLLLVDDICTTGSTLHACLEALHDAAPSMKLSVAVLATTSLV